LRNLDIGALRNRSEIFERALRHKGAGVTHL
jgi:hypothetical protein